MTSTAHRLLLLAMVPGSLMGACRLAMAAPDAPSAPARREAIPSIFRGERALEAPLTVSYRNLPIRDVLADLSSRTKVKLEATRDTGDDKTSLFLKDRPAAEVLGLLASHYDFTWYRNNGVYELNQTAGAKRREAELRNADVAAQLAAIRARMERVGNALAAGKGKLETRQMELRSQLNAGNPTPEQRKQIAEELGVIGDALRPGAGTAVALWNGLTPPQFQQLQARGELKFSLSNGTLSKSMGDQIHQASQAQRDNVKTLRFGAGGVEADNFQLPGQDEPPTDASATIRLSGNSPIRISLNPGAPNRQLRLDFSLASVRGDAMKRNVIPVMWSPMMTSMVVRDAGMQTETEDPALKQEVELFPAKAGLRDPNAGIPVVGSGGGGTRIVAMPLGAGGSWPAGMPTVGEIGEAIQRVTGLEVVADSYVRARLDYAKIMGKKPLIRILDMVANDLKYDWEKDGNRIYFRSHVWFDDRPAEVPNRIINPWKTRVGKTGAATLDDLASLATSLSDPQCQGMQDYWGWLLEGTKIPAPSGVSTFYGSRNDLRFWSTLTVAQKRTALGGEAIPVARMTGLQRTAFTTALMTPSSGLIFNAESAEMPQGDLATGAFTMQVGEMRQQTFSGGEGENTGVISIIGSAIGGPKGAPQPMPRILTPDGQDIFPKLGKTTILDNYQFRYHLSGNETPARTGSVNVPRPEQPQQ